ncbi:MAG: alternative ribosome-rescue factor A [Gammaproteobacteria bacterium]|uniref:Alternative ribosome-rescue factor n=1 Tax=Tolumonas osonensis TaxID=675874 RepID=A0A841G6R8_9GAMM|nr:ribosome alternative rescue factor ArfA [Tolumonas osonensis]MBB6054834.1 alternative ribosome-rescue factor [Tolumonas osonensis]NCB60406.1 alternative ribosome-rescue factor A [Gammaproteobacteria bacterium]
MKTKTSLTGYQHQRGAIADNHLQALVTDKLFRSRVEQNIKGKGSYRRHAKHRRQDESGLKIAA